MFLGEKTYFWLSFGNSRGFCSPEFDSSMTDLAISRLKRNEQHSSILKSQIKTLATFS